MDEDRSMHETGRIPGAGTIADQRAIHVRVRHSRGVDRGDDAASAKSQGLRFDWLARGTRGVDDPLYGHLSE